MVFRDRCILTSGLQSRLSLIALVAVLLYVFGFVLQSRCKEVSRLLIAFMVAVIPLALCGVFNWHRSRRHNSERARLAGISAAQELATRLRSQNPAPEDRQSCFAACCCGCSTVCCGAPIGCFFFLWCCTAAGLNDEECTCRRKYASIRRDFGIALRTTVWAPLATAAVLSLCLLVIFSVDVSMGQMPGGGRHDLLPCVESTARVYFFAPILLIVLGYCTMSSTKCDCVRKTKKDRFPVVEIHQMPGVPRYLLVSDAGSPEVNGTFILCEPDAGGEVLPSTGPLLWRQSSASDSGRVDEDSSLCIMHTNTAEEVAPLSGSWQLRHWKPDTADYYTTEPGASSSLVPVSVLSGLSWRPCEEASGGPERARVRHRRGRAPAPMVTAIFETASAAAQEMERDSAPVAERSPRAIVGQALGGTDAQLLTEVGLCPEARLLVVPLPDDTVGPASLATTIANPVADVDQVAAVTIFPKRPPPPELEAPPTPGLVITVPEIGAEVLWRGDGAWKSQSDDQYKLLTQACRGTLEAQVLPLLASTPPGSSTLSMILRSRRVPLCYVLVRPRSLQTGGWHADRHPRGSLLTGGHQNHQGVPTTR
jgi:hypothetical protein